MSEWLPEGVRTLDGQPVSLTLSGDPAEPKKRAKPKGPRAAERSMKLLRSEGYIVGKTEHWNSFIKIRQDLWGFVDMIALGEDGIVAIQCVNTHLPEHIEKIRANPAAVRWLMCGGKIMIHHWRTGTRKGVKYFYLEVIEIKA